MSKPEKQEVKPEVTEVPEVKKPVPAPALKL